MAKTITQKIIFRNSTTKVLYYLYMDAMQHAMVTGAKAKISATEGERYSA